MAIWQYTFFIIPNNNVSLDNFSPIIDEEGLFNDNLYWTNKETHISFFEEIGNIIPKNKSWSQQIVLFGKENTNCIEVYNENEYVTSVSFRVDFRTDYSSILKQIVSFLRKKDLLLIDEELKVVPLDFEIINKCFEDRKRIWQL